MPLWQPEDSPVLSQFNLKGLNTVVTGGSRGIGLEIVKGFAEAGANVAIIYASSLSTPSLAEELSSKYSVKITAYQADIRSKEQVDNAFKEIERDYGKVDVVVSNSGISTHYDSLEYTEDDFTDIINVNLNGGMWCAQAAGRIFKKQGHGNLIFTASVSAILVNIPQKQAAYNASKAALVHLAKSLAVEWTEFARVNCVSPGFIESDMLAVHPPEWRDTWMKLIPGKRTCQAYELKGAYVFLASPASSYMTGANIVIDGGYTLP